MTAVQGLVLAFSASAVTPQTQLLVMAEIKSALPLFDERHTCKSCGVEFFPTTNCDRCNKFSPHQAAYQCYACFAKTKRPGAAISSSVEFKSQPPARICVYSKAMTCTGITHQQTEVNSDGIVLDWLTVLWGQKLLPFDALRHTVTLNGKTLAHHARWSDTGIQPDATLRIVENPRCRLH